MATIAISSVENTTMVNTTQILMINRILFLSVLLLDFVISLPHLLTHDIASIPFFSIALQ